MMTLIHQTQMVSPNGANPRLWTQCRFVRKVLKSKLLKKTFTSSWCSDWSTRGVRTKWNCTLRSTGTTEFTGSVSFTTTAKRFWWFGARPTVTTATWLFWMGITKTCEKGSRTLMLTSVVAMSAALAVVNVLPQPYAAWRVSTNPTLRLQRVPVPVNHASEEWPKFITNPMSLISMRSTGFRTKWRHSRLRS